jgi:hypothetical protein
MESDEEGVYVYVFHLLYVYDYSMCSCAKAYSLSLYRLFVVVFFRKSFFLFFTGLTNGIDD